MTNTAKHIAQGYHSLTPYLVIRDAAGAIEFYKQAFGATELMRLTDISGRVRHAEIQIGDSVLMIADENPDYPFMRSLPSFGGSPIHFYLYVENVDALAKQAIAAGAKVLFPIQDESEDRRGGLTDPFGHIWHIATRIEEISRQELQRRFDNLMKQDA